MIKILYVEDEPNLAKIVKESLESRDFKVYMVHDGNEALPAFRQFFPDICVLDVMLPNKDGWTIGKEIRSLNTDVPILFLTAKTQTQDLLKGFEAGGNDYIKKPFSLEELIVRINNLLSLMKDKNTRLKPNESIRLGQYLFHAFKYELQIGEHIQSLSHRETQLLQILVQHQNRAVDRKKILMQIWGDDSFFNSRNLDVYIKKIRTYLKDDDRVKIITLKGVGYHFMVE